MALDVEGVVGCGMKREKSLRGSYALEPLHLPLSSSGRLMGILRSIVAPSTALMAFCDRKMTGCSSIRAQVICNELVWDKAIFLQQLAHQFERRPLVPPGLDQHIKNFALGIHGTPEVNQATIDLEIDFVQMPGRMRLRPAFAKIGRDLGSKMVHPAAHRLIGNHDSAFHQQILNVAEAKGEPDIKPDRLLDNLGREAVAAIADLGHHRWLRLKPRNGKPTDNVTRPLCGILAVIDEEIKALKWKLWHRQVERAICVLEKIVEDMNELGRRGEFSAARLNSLGRQLLTYIRSNQTTLVDYGARYRAGRRVSTSLAESAVNSLVAKRMVKSQQMRWSPSGAHLMLQVRAAMVNGNLRQRLRRSPASLYRPSIRSFSQPRLCSEPHDTPEFLPHSSILVIAWQSNSPY
jgi:hypothetical protein